MIDTPRTDAAVEAAHEVGMWRLAKEARGMERELAACAANFAKAEREARSIAFKLRADLSERDREIKRLRKMVAEYQDNWIEDNI